MTSRIETAEAIIEQFSAEELNVFATWFADFQDAHWERQIERDANAGRLDDTIAKAYRDFEDGNFREL